MSELREAMVDKMLLKGFSLRTQKSYLDAVSQLARHYHAAPDRLDQAAQGTPLVAGDLPTVFARGAVFLSSGFRLAGVAVGTDYAEAAAADTGFIVVFGCARDY